jgi:PKD repeat protein
MDRFRLFRLLIGVALVAAFGGAAQAADAVVVHEHGHFAGVTPRRGVSPASLHGSLAATPFAVGFSSNGNLDYNGGPVLHSSAPYVILWTPSGESISTGTSNLISRYFTDVATDSGRASNVYGVDRQYTDATGFADYAQTFSSSSQVIVDTQAYPAKDAANCDNTLPTCVTDTQLQQEAARLVSADGLPTDGPVSSSELASNAPIYFFVLPTDVNVCFNSSTCADNVFCAYHSSFTDGGDNVLYAAIPTHLDQTNPKRCQHDGNAVVQEPNSNQVGDVALSAVSHEDNETITDPLPGTGWFDTGSGNEIGDNCAFFGPFDPPSGTNPNAWTPTLGGDASLGTLFDQLINGDPYYIQAEWSNGDVNCGMRPSPGAVAPSFAASAPDYIGSAVSLDPSTSTSAHPISSATWNFGDGASAFSRGPATPVLHAYSHAGTYTVTLTLVDDRGNLQTASRQLTVTDEPPTAGFAISAGPHPQGSAVSFDGSGSNDPDGTIVSHSWNFGDGLPAAGGASTSHVYAHGGTYTVTLTVTDSDGQKGVTSQQLTIDSPPVATFTTSPGSPVQGIPVRFDGTGSSDLDPGVTISSDSWNFGDGSVATGGPTTSHVYSRPGSYTVRLTVTNSVGLTSTAEQRLGVVLGARITKVVVRTLASGKQQLVISVSGAGILMVGPRRFNLGRARTIRVLVTPALGRLGSARSSPRVELKIQLKFVPRLGLPSRRTVAILLG